MGGRWKWSWAEEVKKKECECGYSASTVDFASDVDQFISLLWVLGER
jgi:hypothetical protein